ncbi:hypothetical protein HYW46_02435 [Candidatus Daviesbacteria bacterium]|nr:hypothetical protein [Candidatus Daviesbacteria bacterium]
MKKRNKKYELPDFADDIFMPDDLMKVLVERNGCKYFWGIPYRIYKSSRFQNMEELYKDEDLEALGGVLLDILVVNKYSIDFKQKTGVQKLQVVVRSSESEDKQLLHKLATGIRANDKPLNRDSIPGTNNDNE